MSLYSSLAEYLQFFAPSFYRQRFFKKLNGLTPENVLKRGIEPEFLWLSGYLKPNDVFMDIGANVGAYIYQAEKIIPAENIIAFEPNPGLYRRLKRIFRKVSIYPVALSDETTEALFKIPVIHGKKVHSRGTLLTNLREKDEEKSVMGKVKVTTLDDWTAQYRPEKISFVKMDVEGNEIRTAKGAGNTIRRFHPTLMIEIEQRHHQEPVWNFIRETEQLGYTAHYLNRKTLQPERLTEEFYRKQLSDNVKNYQQYINNIIFLPNT